MPMESTTRDLVLDFIKTRTGLIATDDSIVFDDLGINGLDAESFMEDFGETFRLDLSNFDITRYALSEHELGNFFLTLYRALFNKKALKKSRFKVSHLYKVIENGKWVDPK